MLSIPRGIADVEHDRLAAATAVVVLALGRHGGQSGQQEDGDEHGSESLHGRDSLTASHQMPVEEAFEPTVEIELRTRL